jgi:hypothetical protein
MPKKWVQAENGADEKLDVYVLVDIPATLGTAETVQSEDPVRLLGPDGRPVRAQLKRLPMGFQSQVKAQ